jgi:hypothetical protein
MFAKKLFFLQGSLRVAVVYTVPWRPHLGLGKIEFAQIIALHAPLPAQFGEADDELSKQLTDMLRSHEGTIGAKAPC